MNTLLKCSRHIPTYASLLSVNVNLDLSIATKSLSNIFCDMYLVYLKFSIILPNPTLFINLVQRFSVFIANLANVVD